MKKHINPMNKIVPAGMRAALADMFLWLVEPKQKFLASHFVGRNQLKDRKFLQYLKCRLDSLDMEKELFGEGKLCGHRNELLILAADRAKHLGKAGLWMEFGVWQGSSVNIIARQTTQQVYGFDSFEGLPETWDTGSGLKSNKRDLQLCLPAVKKNVELVVGWFDKTLPEFVARHPEPVSFVHIDSDLYSSAKCIFQHLRFQDGTVIVFDEYFNYPAWREGEYKAFSEFLAEKKMHAECIGFCPRSGQAAFTLNKAHAV